METQESESTHLRLYTIIYVLLLAGATAQLAFESGPFSLEVTLAGIIVLSVFKTALVAGYYQHLRWEPRSVTTLVLIGTLAVILLAAAASYSIM